MRAVLKRPRILIFDEATASLDAPTAERLAQTVNRLKARCTIFFITHQPPKGVHADDTEAPPITRASALSGREQPIGALAFRALVGLKTH